MSAPDDPLERATPPVACADRRVWERYACQLTVTWPSASNRSPSPEDTPWVGEVHDYSVTGVGVLCARQLPVGQALLVDVHDVARGASQSLRLRVVRCVPQPDGRWLNGCLIVDED